MRKLESQLPVWVRKTSLGQKTNYELYPLFFSRPSLQAQRYDLAAAALQKDVRERFKNFELSAETREELLWFLFRPEWQLQSFYCEVKLNKQRQRIRVGAVVFPIQEQYMVCFPMLEHFMLAFESGTGQTDMAQGVEQAVQHWLQERSEEEGEDFSLQNYQMNDGDFATEVKIELRYRLGPFHFEEKEEEDWLALLSDLEEFDGEQELQEVGTGLHHLYPSELKRAYYREEEVERVLDLLFAHGEESPSFVLVGEEGLGKHSVLEEALHRYYEVMDESLTSPYKTAHKLEVWRIDPNRVISGMSIVGMWQKRMEAILKHLRERVGFLAKEAGTTSLEKDKLVVDNPLALLRIGRSSQNNMNLADLLKPYLEKRQIQLIILATPEVWKLVQERDRRFADLFRVLRLEQVAETRAVHMLLGQRQELELRYEVNIELSAFGLLLDIWRNYFKRQALPGIVAKMMQRLAVKHQGSYIDEEAVRVEFSAQTGLEPRIFDRNYLFEAGEVEQTLKQTLIGQEAAVEALEEVIQVVKARLNAPNRPLGSFLFIGPTGVGKTEAAKVLCRYLLGNEERLTRFDMNEYADEWSLSRLIGDYFQPEGQLSSQVRYQPFSILLLDEIEKAHPKVLDLLLQVLDDARLTDALGRVVDFSNTIIIMTSNIGAEQLNHRLGFERGLDQAQHFYQKAVEQYFRPEFINRIHRLVVFKALELEHIFEIAKLQIQSLLNRDGFVRRTTILNVEPTALEWVAKRGYDGKMGGRALKRQIERDLTMFTAEQLIQTPSDSPLIFNILLREGKLIPQIEPLDFIPALPPQWLPPLPQAPELRRAFRSIYDQVLSLQQKLQDWEQIRAQSPLIHQADFQGNWLYYDFKNRLAEQKEQIQHLILTFHSDYPQPLPEQALRVKLTPGSLIVKRSDARRNPERNLQKDLLFQKTAFDELRYLYQHAPEEFTKQQSIYLQHYLDYQTLETIWEQLCQKPQPQKHRLEIQSLIANQGQDEIAYLLKTYLELCPQLGLSLHQLDKHNLLIEGYAVQTLLRGEIGYHLFHRPHQNPLPLKISLHALSEAASPVPELKVLRLYDLSLGNQHKSSTVTDLRSGFSNQAKLGPNEFKLFVHAALYKNKTNTT